MLPPARFMSIYALGPLIFTDRSLVRFLFPPRGLSSDCWSGSVGMHFIEEVDNGSI